MWSLFSFEFSLFKNINDIFIFVLYTTCLPLILNSSSTPLGTCRPWLSRCICKLFNGLSHYSFHFIRRPRSITIIISRKQMPWHIAWGEGPTWFLKTSPSTLYYTGNLHFLLSGEHSISFRVFSCQLSISTFTSSFSTRSSDPCTTFHYEI